MIELPGGKPAEFFTVSFLKSEPTGTHAERGYWSWSGDGKWMAPDNPKLAFASQQRALYKLYVFENLSTDKKQARSRLRPRVSGSVHPHAERRVASGLRTSRPRGSNRNHRSPGRRSPNKARGLRTQFRRSGPPCLTRNRQQRISNGYWFCRASGPITGGA